VTIILIPAHALGGRADASLQRPVAALRIAGVGWASGRLTNLRLGTSGISLSDDLAFVRNGRVFGIYISPPQPVDGVFDRVAASFVQQTGGTADLELEARSSADATGWSPWTAVPIDGQSVGLSGGASSSSASS